ncbi:MAG: heparinase II/III family protein, partial [Rhodospirillales bacterium]|nr:heparinase II/III family protein [Acetobacter sp.]
MLLDHVSIQTLAGWLAPHLSRPAWPGLLDPVVKERARGQARRAGWWEELGRLLDPHTPIPVLRRSVFRDYQRTGNRTRGEAAILARAADTERAALALWMEHPAADLDYFQDLLWAWCETWWKIPAHETLSLELVDTLRARQLAEYRFVFADRLEPEVSARLAREIADRALVPALDWNHPDPWQTRENNWNTVCNSNLIVAGLYEITDPLKLATFIHPLIRRMDYALAYYTDDGGCVEGASYWEYGFCNFVDAAIALHERTGGALNLMAADPKIERICRYPLAAYLAPPLRAAFADGDHGWLNAESALKINRFFPVAELFSLTSREADGSLRLREMRSLALDAEEPPPVPLGRTDYLLPDLGYAKIHAPQAEVVLAVQAGNNGVSHNHNDLGSFILCRDGVCVLTDPGAPVYRADTFGPGRYDILVCRSRGHSVPVVNGHEQAAGAEFYAGITVQEAGEMPGGKSVHVDLTQAYPAPTLRRLERRFTIAPNGDLHIRDDYAF